MKANLIFDYFNFNFKILMFNRLIIIILKTQ
jgi:hypothetical protein